MTKVKDSVILGLIESAAEKRDDGYMYTLDGDLGQMAEQYDFLINQGFRVGKANVYPALATEEEYHRAIKAIWEKRISGWWHYRDVLVEKLKVCTNKEFDLALGVNRPKIYRVIRASIGYEVVVVGFYSPEKKKQIYYLHNDNIETSNGEAFEEVPAEVAEQYICGGQADGMGFGKIPKEPFAYLEDIEDWRKKCQAEAYKEMTEKHTEIIKKMKEKGK